MLMVASAGCSSMSAWGDYTGDGQQVVGRNWDLNAGLFEKWGKYLTVAVYNPSGSFNPVADINYAGALLFQSGISRPGLFMDLQNGSMVDPSDIPERGDTNFRLFQMLLNPQICSI
jgi:hypothetical protein